MDLLQELLAEREIRKIVALYPQYADNADEVAWAALFSEDGELCIGDTVVKGREALAAWLLNTLKGPPMRHMMVNSFIEVVDDDTARGSLDMALLLRKDDRWMVGPTPRYDEQRFASCSIACKKGCGGRMVHRTLFVSIRQT